MDDEEAWRAAELEMRYADAFVEDEDDDLLKLLPCANDPGLVQPPPPLAVNVAIESAASPTSTSSFSLFAASPLLDERADGGGDPTSRGVLAFPPIHGTSFMLRGDDGSIRWVTAADRADEEAEHAADEDDELAGRREIHDRLTRTRGAGLGLLDGGSITVAELLETLKAEAQEEQIARAQRPPPPPSTRSSVEEQLWVSKYRPRAFRDILSDEAINLQLLQWLKSWDASVFDAPPAQDGDGAAGRSWASSEAHATPRDLRPEERIAILTGPPGVGKTTLVHVLAAHCGYEVMEINASVERTASRIESMIKTAVSAGGSGARARRVVGQRPPDSGAPPTSLMDHLLAPKCLVIDEIDGISANVAQLLIKQDIHRPVFCLCNDLYVPALRPLRQHCYNVVHLPAIRPQRLQSRLQQIAEMEGMELDSAVVAELVRCSSGDVRSCLNTLQFLRLLPNTSSSSTTTSSATTPRQAALDLVRHMHSKDARSDVWGAWNAVFTKPERSKCIQLLHKVYGVDYEALMEASTQHAIAAVAARKARETARVIGTSNTSSSSTNPTHSRLPAYGLEVVSGFRVDAGFLHLSHVLRDCPDAASLLDGLFDNYSLRSYPDFSMAKSASVAAAFAEQDILTTAAFQRAASLIPFAEQYNTITALHCYVCCSSTTRGEKLQYPREHARLLHLSSESSLVIRRLQDACRAELNAFMSSAEVLSAELCPMLCRCLFDASIKIPSHSIASIASLPTTVRHLLEVSVARHVAYGLTYRKRPRSQAVMIAPAHGGGEGESEESWRLAPEVDCLGGLIRPFSSAPVGFKRPRGSWGSGGASASYSAEGRQQRFGDADATHRPGRRDAATKQPFFTVREDVRQMLVVEIERYIIAQQAATRSRAAAARDVGQPAHANDGAVAPGTASAASMSTEATLATTSHTNAAAVRDAPATTVAAPVKEAAATPAPLTSLAAFFGMKKTNTTTRRVAPCTTPTAATAAAAAAIQSSSTAKPKASQVRYTYQDGATNAVKMPAVLADFM